MHLALNPLVDGMSGAAKGVLPNGLVTYRRANSQIARSYVVPANPGSSFQNSIRAWMSLAAAAYKALPEAGALAWNALAADYSSQDPFGGEAPLSGINLFSRINMYRQMAGQSISSTLPTVTTPPTLGEVSVDNVTISSPDVDADVSVDGTDADIVFARFSNPLYGTARFYRENECSVKGSFGACFSAVAADAVHYDLVVSDFTPSLAANDIIGLVLVPLTSEYLPGPNLLIPQFVTD